MSQPCPNVIQISYSPANVNGNPPAPLVLIHDGSGTAFSYFLFGDLGRDVWAIQNTELGKYSMGDMARRYIRCLQDAGISGQVILGGWSFGGYMSLAMSHILAMDTSLGISVDGLLLIDTSYYTTEDTAGNVECSDDGTFAFNGVSEATSNQIKKSFEACESLLREWELPNWSGAAFNGQQSYIRITMDVG
ncbi:unnamed protein product [Fusarium langsethiae]|nr:unnamed protein product [Fusarium langsethiae]